MIRVGCEAVSRKLTLETRADGVGEHRWPSMGGTREGRQPSGQVSIQRPSSIHHSSCGANPAAYPPPDP